MEEMLSAGWQVARWTTLRTYCLQPVAWHLRSLRQQREYQV